MAKSLVEISCSNILPRTVGFLAGKGLFDDNGVPTEVGEGDVCYTGDGEAHAIRNVGETELRLMALILYR